MGIFLDIWKSDSIKNNLKRDEPDKKDCSPDSEWA